MIDILNKVLEESSNTGAILGGVLGGTGAVVAVIIYKFKEIVEIIKKLRGKSWKEIFQETMKTDKEVIKEVIKKEQEAYLKQSELLAKALENQRVQKEKEEQKASMKNSSPEEVLKEKVE